MMEVARTGLNSGLKLPLYLHGIATFRECDYNIIIFIMGTKVFLIVRS
jgi:hypothetical protein